MSQRKNTDACECVKIQQRILEREVDEDLRQERLAAWWKKYRFVVLGGVVCVILGTIACEWYQAWQTKIKTAESDQFEQALVWVSQDQTEPALAALDRLAESGKTGYRYLAQLEKAGFLITHQREQEGYALLAKIMDDSQTPQPLQDAATLAFVGHQLGQEKAATLQQRLASIVARPKSAFYGEAMVLKAMLEILEHNPQAAQQTIQTALTAENLTPVVRQQLTTLKETVQN